MNSSRDINYIHGELVDEFPKLTQVALARLINLAYDDGGLAINVEIQILIDTVEDQRYYTIPITNRPLRITGVQFKNSNDEYKAIPRHIGQRSLGESIT